MRRCPPPRRTIFSPSRAAHAVWSRRFRGLVLLTIVGLAVTGLPARAGEYVAWDLPETSLLEASDAWALGPLGPRVRPGDLSQRLMPWLDEVALPGAMEDWPAGMTIAQQCGRLVSFEEPLDLVRQYRVSPDYVPGYWPEHDPGQTVGAAAHDDLLGGWQVVQGGRENPLQTWRDQLQLLADSPGARRERLGWLLAYLWAHRRSEDRWQGAVDMVLSDQAPVRRDVFYSLALPPLLQVVPQQLTGVTPVDGEVAVDLRLTLGFAYDSVGQFEEALLSGAARGLGALVFAGRGELASAQEAERVAARLRREGRLPAGFRVIRGEYIQARTGAVLGLFVQDRVLEGMTMAATVNEIHAQGGLAYLARPGDIGAAPALRRLPFDGYLIQTGNFELFRTMLLLNDPRLQNKPALYASNSNYAVLAGMPYTSVPLDREAPDALYAGLAQRKGYAAGALYMPWMMALFLQPIAAYQKTLNEYFVLNDFLATKACGILRADNVILRTSWDDEMRNLISLGHAPGTIADILAGDSRLTAWPELTYMEAEYGRVAVGYDRRERTWLLGSRWRW